MQTTTLSRLTLNSENLEAGEIIRLTASTDWNHRITEEEEIMFCQVYSELFSSYKSMLRNHSNLSYRHTPFKILITMETRPMHSRPQSLRFLLVTWSEKRHFKTSSTGDENAPDETINVRIEHAQRSDTKSLWRQCQHYNKRIRQSLKISISHCSLLKS